MKYAVIVSRKGYEKICSVIPIPLLRLIQSSMQFATVSPSLLSLRIGDINIFDKKCNNSVTQLAFKNNIFGDYNHCPNKDNVKDTILKRSFSYYISLPVAPKVKETHFKIISAIYPVNDFLNKRFKFEVDLCAFCDAEEETTAHLFFECSHTQSFWTDVRCWLSLKIDGIPSPNYIDFIYYLDNLDSNVSDCVNLVFMLGKYHIHCSKWCGSSPNFIVFMSSFTKYFQSLKLIKNKKAVKMYECICKALLF